MKLSALSLAVVLLAGPVVAVADELDDAFQSLKDAESKKDAAEVKKWAAQASELARKAIAVPAPESAEDKKAWQAHQDYAKDVDQYSEYALYAVAVQAQPATAVELFGQLEAQNPKSKYLADSYGQYIAALTQSGGGGKVGAIAEKAVANFPENEDLLMLAASAALSKNQADRALSLANRLTTVMAKKAKPEAVSQADWDKKKATALGQGYYIAGLVYTQKQQFAFADKNLRSALPLIRGNNAMMGPALFSLGVANYQLGKMTNSKVKVSEAAKFSEEAAAIPGGHQDQAYRNAQIMKTEASKMR